MTCIPADQSRVVLTSWTSWTVESVQVVSILKEYLVTGNQEEAIGSLQVVDLYQSKMSEMIKIPPSAFKACDTLNPFHVVVRLMCFFDLWKLSRKGQMLNYMPSIIAFLFICPMNRLADWTETAQWRTSSQGKGLGVRLWRLLLVFSCGFQM